MEYGRLAAREGQSGQSKLVGTCNGFERVQVYRGAPVASKAESPQTVTTIERMTMCVVSKTLCLPIKNVILRLKCDKTPIIVLKHIVPRVHIGMYQGYISV